MSMKHMRCVLVCIGLIIGGTLCTSPQKSVSRPAQRKFATLQLSPKALQQGDTLHIHARLKEAVLQHWQIYRADSLLLSTKDSLAVLSTAMFPIGRHTLYVKCALQRDTMFYEKHHLSVEVRAAAPPETYTYLVQEKYPHDVKAYTQGLFWEKDVLYEATGQYGHSLVRRSQWPGGDILSEQHLDESLFGEGIAALDTLLYQLTWKSHQGLIYNKHTLTQVGTFSYPTEGWGLTSWQNELIMSDGSENIYFYSPLSWKILRTLQVYDDQGPVKGLNELEMIDNELYANIYEKDEIVIIDPYSGVLRAKVSLENLLDRSNYASRKAAAPEVLNGIAYIKPRGTLLVTGKYWPYMYEILLAKQTSSEL